MRSFRSLSRYHISMVKISPSAVVIFTILYLTGVLNALEGNLTSNRDDSPENSAYASPSVLSKNPSTARFFPPSAWSKGGLKSNIDKFTEDKDQDLSILDKEFDLWNIRKLFKYVASLLNTMNESNDKLLDKLTNDEKIKSQIAANEQSLEKSENDVESEMQKSRNSTNLNKSTAGQKIQNSANNNSNKAEIDMNGETRNVPSFSDLDKLAEMRNSAINGTENKSSNIEEMQNTSNTDVPTPSKRQLQNSKDMKQNTMNKDTLHKSTQGVKMQNPSNNHIQVESTSTLKSNQPDEDSTRTKFKDPEGNIIDKITSDDITDDTTDKSKIDKNQTYNDNEREDDGDTNEDNKNEDDTDEDNRNEDDTGEDDKNEEDTDEDNENEDDTNEDNRNEDEVEDDYTNKNEYIKDENKNGNKANYINKNICNNEDNIDKNKTKDENENENNNDNESNTNKNKVEDDFVSENNDENKTGSNSQTPQTIIVLDEETRDMSPNITNQQKIPETLNPNSQINNTDYIIGDKSRKNIKEENPSLENESTGNEFIDDYINNPVKKFPARESEQSNNTETFNLNGNSAATKTVLKVTQTSGNNFEDNNSPTTAPLVIENLTNISMPFGKSQNTANKVWPERKDFLQPIFNEEKKDKSFNQVHSDEKYPQNIQNTFISDGEDALSPQKGREGVSQNLVPLQKNPYYMDLPNSFATLQKDYNSFVETPVLEFQNYNPSAQALYNGAPDINIYGPEIAEPLNLFPNQAIPLQNEYNLNDQYSNPDVKTPDIVIEKHRQFEQIRPTIFEQDLLSNNQYIPYQVTPNRPLETAHFTYLPEMPDNVQNVEQPVFETKRPSNYLISDNLQYDPSLHSLHNEIYPFKNSDNSLNKMVPQHQADATIPQNHINKIETLNQPSLSDNLSSQSRIFDEQTLFSQNVIETQLLQNKMTSLTQPNKTETKSETLSDQKEFKDMEFPLSENGTNHSKEIPENSFRNSETKSENKPENEASSQIVLENSTAKSSSPQTKVTTNNTLNDIPQKNENFDESEKREQDILNSDFGGNESYDESSNNNYDTDEEESDYGEEESEYDEEESEYDEEELEYDEEELDYDNDDDDEIEQSSNPTDGTTNDKTVQTTQKSYSDDANETTESTTTFKSQNEAGPSNQDENIATELLPTFKTQTAEVSPDKDKKFNSILELIYNFSNNPFFAAVRNEGKQTS